MSTWPSRCCLTASGITRLLDGLQPSGYVDKAACAERRAGHLRRPDRGRPDKLRPAADVHVAGHPGEVRRALQRRGAGGARGAPGTPGGRRARRRGLHARRLDSVAGRIRPSARRNRRYHPAPMSAIVSLHAREILDSRGNPTVEVDVVLESARAAARPCRRARRPARTRRSSCATATPRYGGKGVDAAVANVNADDRRRARRHGRGRPARDRRGARSSSTARRTRAAGRERDPRRLAGGRPAAAAEAGLPLYRYLGGADAHVLPVPMMNIINGGAHADNTSTSRSS